MSVIVRSIRASEGRLFLAVHDDAVRGLAVADYPRSIVDIWAPPTITEGRLARFRDNRDGELRVVAELDGEVVGVGALVPSRGELRACYVRPCAARRRVGTAIVAALEDLARSAGARQLSLHASLTAVPFYTTLGYVVTGRTTIEIGPGVAMDAVTMRKTLEA